MISTTEVKNTDETFRCSGCGAVIGTGITINAENPVDAQISYLTLCPTCKTALIDKLAISPKSFEFEHVRIVLEHEINILKADLKSIGNLWEKGFGLPLTIERLEEEKTSMFSVGYLHTLGSIKECERMLEAIK